ncbi:hypothetical protein [Lentisalinibacter orientalis]|uniref:hypothetical protein n=1 Tax=Lentisalinibacter orientalis TaxID=2992241 RepID=UPI00386A9E3E
MTRSTTITVVALDPPSEREDEWNDWYTNVHSPGRFECGLLGFRRFELVPGEPPVDTRQEGLAKYLAIMEWPDSAALSSAEYDAVTKRWAALPPDSFEHVTMGLGKFARGVLELIDEIPPQKEFVLPKTEYVFMSAHDVPASHAEEFNEWYVTEHVPPILEQPGFNSVRRYAHLSEEFPPMLARGGELFSHLAIWEIDDPKAFRNPVFAGYTPTPWQQRMRRLFTLKMSNVYQEIGRGIALR